MSLSRNPQARPSGKGRTNPASTRAKRRDHATRRIQAGGELTEEERTRISILLTDIDATRPCSNDDVALIEHAVAVYWRILASSTGNERRQLDKIAKRAAGLIEAMAETPFHLIEPYLLRDKRWSLVAFAPHALDQLESEEVPLPDFFNPPIRRQRIVRYEHHGGSRIELVLNRTGFAGGSNS